MFEPFWHIKRKKTKLSPELEAYLATPEGRAELLRYFATPEGQDDLARSIHEDVKARHPPLGKAVLADVALFSKRPLEPRETTREVLLEALRMSLETEAFLPVLLYRLRARMLAHEIPMVPALLHHACMILAQIDIGRGVSIEPGVYIPHGQVVMDGQITIGAGTIVSPWVTLGRNGSSLDGPRIGRHVFIGTGAMILGPVTVGDHARVDANAVVLTNVPDHAIVGGIPAKVLGQSTPPDA